MYWKSILSPIGFLLFMPLLPAQTHEVGLGAGLGYYVGDVNPTFHWRFPHVGATGFYRYNLDNHWSFRGGLVYQKVSAADSLGVFDFQSVRNLSFESEIFEVHGAVEFNFLPFFPGRNNSRSITPHVFWGLGLFHFNPKTTYNGELVALATLGTEGQGTPGNAFYSKVAGAMPFGIGLKWRFAPRWSLMAEWGMRMTFTDYLDDVSSVYTDLGQLLTIRGQAAVDLADPNPPGLGEPPRTSYMRGTRNDVDWYSFLHVSLVFNFRKKVVCYN
jgi:hypothetical protein